MGTFTSPSHSFILFKIVHKYSLNHTIKEKHDFWILINIKIILEIGILGLPVSASTSKVMNKVMHNERLNN